MAAPLDIDREQVRMLAMTHGCREAARMLGLNASTVTMWSKRGKWFAKQVLPPSMIQKITPKQDHNGNVVSVVIPPADAMAARLAEDERETRLSLSKSARRLAREAEDAPLEMAGDVLQAAKVAGLVHKWGNEGATTQPLMSGIVIGEGGQIVINQQNNILASGERDE